MEHECQNQLATFVTKQISGLIRGDGEVIVFCFQDQVVKSGQFDFIVNISHHIFW